MKLFLFLTSLLLLNTLYAKDSDYSIIIQKKFDNKLLDIAQDYDRDISAVGFTNNYKTINEAKSYNDPFEYLKSVNSAHGTHMQLIKVNDIGEIIIDKSSSLSQFSKAIAIAKTPTNGYYIGGHSMDGELIILKLDANANLIFKKKFGTKNIDKLNNIIRLKDGGVLAIGTSTTSRDFSDPLFKTGLGLNDIFLTRFSVDGRELWSKKYGTHHDDTGIDAIEAYDGSIVVIGKTFYDNNRDISMMRIGENGNKIWIKYISNKTLTTPHRIIRLRDNNFLMSLSQTDTMGKEQIRLIKFDLQKNILVDKKIHTTYSSALKDIKEYANGGLVGVGYVRDGYNTDALVMILNSKLSLLYQAHFGGENYDALNAVTILHNSQAAAAGIYTFDDSQEANMWIIKLNSDATIAQKSAHADDFYEMLCILYKDEIKANQIKIKKDLSIEFTDKKLYFNVGKYKLTKNQKIFLEKFSKKLLPFLHRYKNQIKTLEVSGHTSSEWANSSFDDRYLKNAKLSLNRSYSTLSYIFNTQDKQTKHWLIKVLKGSGYSYSKNISFNKIEDKELSRRVSFKILLNEIK
ncbi:MAG: hypothetical protein L3I99_06165 [Sulfurimonas sp.]|nr:hypothetical protein [Sulfurimonas sp.]